MAELLKIKLAKDFQKNLFPDDAFYKNARQDKVDEGFSSVKVGNAGSKPTLHVDPAVLPLTVSERTDTIVEYSLREFATAPDVVRWSNQFTLDYDKGKEILADHKSVVLKGFADYTLQAWYHTWDVKTSGSARVATAPSATGNRKAVTAADMLNILAAMDRDDVPDDGGRYAILPPAMYQDIVALADFDLTRYLQTDLIRKGILGEIYGCKIMKRSETPRFDNAFAIKAIGAAAAATDNLSALFWHKDFVRFGHSKVQVFLNKGRGDYLGDTMNVTIAGNGSINRTDAVGTYTLTQIVA